MTSIAQANGSHADPPVLPLKACYREAAAWNLYEIVKPAGGLSWLELSDGQKNAYRALVDQAVAKTARVQ